MRKYLCLVLILFLLNLQFPQALSNIRSQVHRSSVGDINSKMDFKTKEERVLEVLKTLQQLNIAKGDEKGDFQLKSKLKREDAVILICRLFNRDIVKERREARFQQQDQRKFKDVVQGSYYAPYIDFSTSHSIVSGISQNEFGVGKTITQKEFLTLLLRVLNYEVIWNKTDIAKLSKEVGISNHLELKLDEAIFREEAFLMIYHTLFAKSHKSEEAFYKQKGFSLSRELDDFHIKAVASNNLREVEISFNKPLSTYLNEAKFQVKNAHLGRIEGRVSADDSKLILSCGINMQNGGFYEFEIEGIYPKEGYKLEKTVVSFVTFDVKVPEITRVEQVNDAVEISFDEPVANYGKISIHPVKREEDASSPSLKNLHFRENNTKLMISGLVYEYDVDYIMNFTDYRDYAGKRGIDLEKEIIFRKETK